MSGREVVTFFRESRLRIRESKHYATYIAIVVLHFLNTFDAMMTTIWVELGLAYEANPLIAGLFDIGPHAFLLAKLITVTIFLAVLWKFVDKRLARAGVWLGLVVYMMIMAFHSTYLLFPDLDVGALFHTIRTLLSI